MPGARFLGRVLAATYQLAGGPEQQVAALRDSLAAASAAEAAARAEGRGPDAARLAREVCLVRAWLLSSAITGRGFHLGFRVCGGDGASSSLASLSFCVPRSPVAWMEQCAAAHGGGPYVAAPGSGPRV